MSDSTPKTTSEQPKKPQIKISVNAIISEMKRASNLYSAYLNPTTGELITLGDDEFSLVEDNLDISGMQAWERELVPKVREVLYSGNFVMLPARDEIDPLSIMRDFATTLDEKDIAEELLEASEEETKTTQEWYYRILDECDLRTEWNQYRQQKLHKLAVEWCEKNSLLYG